jgi:hypothetical protein
VAGENILALQMSVPHRLPPNPYGATTEGGFRAVMAVTNILAKLQTTILYGNSLYMMGYDVGQYNSQQGFIFFTSQTYNRPSVWGELSVMPPSAIPGIIYGQGMQSAFPPPPPPKKGTCTLLSSGFDPSRGYWMEFAGNYFLSFPLFKDWPNVIRDGPAFQGRTPRQTC